MNYKIEIKDKVTMLRLDEQRLDTAIAAELKTQLISLINEHSPKMIVDLKSVEYADSSGLGAILFGIRQARDIGGACKLINLNNRVLSLIRIAKLDHVIEAFDNEKEALASFAEA